MSIGRKDGKVERAAERESWQKVEAASKGERREHSRQRGKRESASKRVRSK